MDLIEMTRKPEKTKVNMLLNAGPRAIEVFNTFQFEDGKSPESFADVKEQFSAYCEGKNISYER